MDTKVETLEQVAVRSGFGKPSDVIADHERPGLLRIPTHPFDTDPETTMQYHDFDAYDWTAPSAPTLNLETMGFDCVDITHKPDLLTCLHNVRQANYLSEDNIKTIRRQMTGTRFKLSNGKRLRLLYIAPEGFIFRKGGPNRLAANPDETITESNGHVTAPVMHGDQDVYGTPVKQILKGLAPWLFRHNTPDGTNKKSPVFLLNFWLPLQQITQPLGLLDRSTFDNKKHQIRYALPTDSFLEREDEMVLNDIWTILYDKGQRWYFNPELHVGNAYVFDTLGEPHGGLILSGEVEAEKYYRRVQSAVEAIKNNDEDKLTVILKDEKIQLPTDTTAPLRRGVEQLENLLNQAKGQTIDTLKASTWLDDAEKALDLMIRKSIEMRAVGIIY